MIRVLVIALTFILGLNETLALDSLRARLSGRMRAASDWQGRITGPDGGFNVTWPDGSTAQYLFGAGLWVCGPSSHGPLTVVQAFNPLTGRSWMLPGTAADTLLPDSQRRRLYAARSGVHDDLPGRAENLMADAHSIVRFTAASDRQFDPSSWTFVTGVSPLPLDITQHTFSWIHGPLRDVIVIVYDVRNVGQSPLHPVTLGMAFDPDLVDAQAPTVDVHRNAMGQAERDAAYRLVRAWKTQHNGTQPHDSLGHVGLVLLEGPAKDGSIDAFLPPDRQAGIHAIRYIRSSKDILTNDQRVAFMTEKRRDSDTMFGDVRAVVSAAPVRLEAGQSMTFAVALIFAEAANMQHVASTLYDAYYGGITTDVVAGAGISELRASVVDGDVVVDLPSDISPDAVVEIVTVEGTVLERRRVAPSAPSLTFSMTQRAAAAYVIRLTDGNTVLTTSVVVTP
ncbi:MAG TPA: hypothetical protein DIS79_08035 [Bacteroidetes bacterium]|nr:hypothetical protein [Bacteroidota bacterium]HRK05848.1 hypothetical protein [Chlorobiota bacterium]